jgi:hypothetical protein
MNGLDALLQAKDGGTDVSDSHCIHQLCIVGVQVMTKMKAVNGSCQLLYVSDELCGPRTESYGTLQLTV